MGLKYGSSRKIRYIWQPYAAPVAGRMIRRKEGTEMGGLGSLGRTRNDRSG